MGEDILGYEGRRVLVTGCSSGIGRATAELLLKAGAEVVGFDYRPSDLPLSSFLLADLGKTASMDAAVEQLDGPVHALFNCAGVYSFNRSPLEVIGVNFIGTRHLTERLLPLIPPGGAVATVASMGGVGWPNRLPALLELTGTSGVEEAREWLRTHEIDGDAYLFSKEAVIVWTYRLSAEVAMNGVRANCTLPGAVETPMLVEVLEKLGSDEGIDQSTRPMGRRGRPEEQALPLLALNSPLSSYLNGVALPVDGGTFATMCLARSAS